VLLDVDGCAAIEQLGTQLGAALQQNRFHPVLITCIVRGGAKQVSAGQCER
jgi:hypoxanthine phosphoribosyltransferase